MLYLIIGVCAFSVLQFVVGVAALFRFLPALLSLARYLTRLLFVCSFRLYRQILKWVAPLLRRQFNIDVLDGWARLAATVLLSLVFVLGALLLLQISVSVWSIVPTALHGLIVGLLWDDLVQPGELQMGIKLS